MAAALTETAPPLEEGTTTDSTPERRIRPERRNQPDESGSDSPSQQQAGTESGARDETVLNDRDL